MCSCINLILRTIIVVTAVVLALLCCYLGPPNGWNVFVFKIETEVDMVLRCRIPISPVHAVGVFVSEDRSARVVALQHYS